MVSAVSTPAFIAARATVGLNVEPGANNPDGLGAPYSYEEMVVPTNTTVTLDIVSADVVHSWWIPELGGKFQAVPGYHSYTWFKISKPGIYRGQCAALCGRDHGFMPVVVDVRTPDDFKKWVDEQKAQLKQAAAPTPDAPGADAPRSAQALN